MTICVNEWAAEQFYQLYQFTNQYFIETKWLFKKKENLFQFSLKAALADDSKERSSAGYLGHFNNFLKRGLCNTYLTIG